MRFPELSHFGLIEGVVPEAGTGAGRVILWVAGSEEDGVRRWERICDVAGPLIDEREGWCATRALLRRFEQETRSPWERLWRRIRPAAVEDGCVTPDGAPVRPSGRKRVDLLLVWSKDACATYDREQIEEHWPGLENCRRLGSNLFLVSGVGEHQTFSEAHKARSEQERLHAKEDHIAELSRPENDPRQQAEKMLALAQAGTDSVKQAIALTDLGSVLVRTDEADTGAQHLEQALALARQSGDTATEYDALAVLGSCYLKLGRVPQALETFQQVLTYARTVGDRFSEKMVLGQLGEVYSRLLQPGRALEYFEPALQIARELGDTGNEAQLGWSMAICHDELGQRDQALHSAQAAVDIYQRLGAPQGAEFADYLDRFRRGNVDLKTDVPDSAGEQDDVSAYFVGGPILANSVPSAANQFTSPPSPLRMAYTAARSMAKFVKSGFKTVSRVAHEKRLATCDDCEHHTGVRCKLCGCFTKQKSWMPHEHCPATKWPV